MKRWSVMLLAGWIAGSLGTSVWSEEAKPATDTKQYLDQLQVKLDHTAQRVNQPNAGGSTVVGLRGSKQEPVSKQLYWKGKKGPAPVTPEEVKAFRAAIEQAQNGHKPEAITALNSFSEKYPKSGLLPDVQETLRVLNTQ